MPKIPYVKWKPRKDAIRIILQANEILDEYAKQGYDLSVRQLYYQFVARDIIPNNQKSYKRLGSIISKARDAGYIDWNRIQDRGRATYAVPHWKDGENFLQDQSERFHLDLWEGQKRKCQVWVEKEALADVVGRVATAWDVPYFPNKGYVSASSIWLSSQLILDECNEEGGCRDWVILHLGDHDPSGIDMSRDIEERLHLYSTPYREEQQRPRIRVKRIALNMEQVEAYKPPPNFAKETDTRYEMYAEEYGTDCWELDALEPNTITDIIENEIKKVLENISLYNKRMKETKRIQTQLSKLKLP